MLEESVTLANSTGQGNLQREDKVDRIHVLAPEERPARQEIIKKRLEMSRFWASGQVVFHIWSSYKLGWVDINTIDRGKCMWCIETCSDNIYVYQFNTAQFNHLVGYQTEWIFHAVLGKFLVSIKYNPLLPSLIPRSCEKSIITLDCYECC